ncbi:bifunctional phosphoglucose/phosphomannose isomerase, partial [Patescibacteria group bacterium]|nr:bifunctional phosphoglucose/phosphomannose isomerase [Patescibacteria group bacterium]
ITPDIFEKQGGTVVEYGTGGKTPLEECGELLQFGGFVSCYLAMLNKVDPYLIPFVDSFKRRMSK